MQVSCFLEDCRCASVMMRPTGWMCLVSVVIFGAVWWFRLPKISKFDEIACICFLDIFGWCDWCLMMMSSPELYHLSFWNGLDMFWSKPALHVWSPGSWVQHESHRKPTGFWGSLCGRHTGDKWIWENLIFDVMCHVCVCACMCQPWCQRILFDFKKAHCFACNTK